MVAPAPLAIVPVQVQDVTVTAGVPKDSSREEHIRSLPISELFKVLWNERWILPEGLENFCVEANSVHFDEALQIFFTLHRIFISFQCCLKLDLRQVYFSEQKRTIVLLQNGRAWPDKGNRVKRVGAVDGDDAPTILEEEGELASCVLRVIDNLLQDGSIDCVPVCIVYQNADGVQNLTL